MLRPEDIVPQILDDRFDPVTSALVSDAGSLAFRRDRRAGSAIVQVGRPFECCPRVCGGTSCWLSDTWYPHWKLGLMALMRPCCCQQHDARGYCAAGRIADFDVVAPGTCSCLRVPYG